MRVTLAFTLILSACEPTPNTTGDGGNDLALASAPVDFGSAVIPSEYPRSLPPADRERLKQAVTSGAAPAMRFAAVVDRALGGGDVYAYHAWYSALMFQVTGETRYADDAIARVDDFVSGEEALISAGQRAEIAGDSYLEIGDRIGDLALTYDWCHERVTATQRDRWRRYANQAVWNVWHPDQASWGGAPHPWSGWSVNNPANNYYYSFLRATMLLGLVTSGEDPQAADWLAMFRETKLRDQLFPMFERDLQGGGSREGTGYGVSMRDLYRLYVAWESATGERIADRTAHTRASMSWLMHAIVPTRDFLVPVGDHARDSTAALFDYHRDYANVLEHLYPADPMAARLKWLFANSSVPEMSQQFMRYSDFLYDNPSLVPHALDDVHPVYHAPGTGHVFARSSWDKTATLVHTLCGPYTESHAHHDQGSFLLYKNEWLAYDQNIKSHSGIVQEERAHNLVRLDGATMREGAPAAQLYALEDEPAYTFFACDVTPIYDGAAGKVERELVWLKPDVLIVFDRVASGGARVWQLSSPISPSVNGRVVTLAGAKSTLAVHSLLPATAAISTVDWASADPDMSGGWRVEIADSSGSQSLFLTVLVLDGAASVAADDAAGVRGVKVGLPGGARTVRFSEASRGGTIDGTALKMGIQALPLLTP